MTHLKWDPDQIYLYAFLKAEPFMAQAEIELKEVGQGALAEKLNRLQIDMSTQAIQDHEPLDEPAAGPQTAALREDFEFVTPERLHNTLHLVKQALVSEALKNAILELIEEMPKLDRVNSVTISPIAPANS